MLIRGMLLVMLLAASMPPAAQEKDQCEFTVGWTPYGRVSYLDDQGQAAGADIDIIRAVGKEIGCEVDFRQAPWARILVEIENGSLDATSSASRTPEREQFASFSIPYRETEMAIYVREGESAGHDLPDLASVQRSDFRLGVVTGYYYGPEYAALSHQPAFAEHVDSAADYKINARKLLHGRVDGVLVEDINVFKAEAQTENAWEQVERHPLQIAGDQLHVMFSRKTVSEQQLAEVNAALQNMLDDGRLQQILNRHF